MQQCREEHLQLERLRGHGVGSRPRSDEPQVLIQKSVPKLRHTIRRPNQGQDHGVDDGSPSIEEHYQHKTGVTRQIVDQANSRQS
jgi:hypothetical protein